MKVNKQTPVKYPKLANTIKNKKGSNMQNILEKTKTKNV